MDREHYNRLRDHLPEICIRVVPKQILPYLRCLTIPDQQQIKCDYRNDGDSEGARSLIDHLYRRKGSYEEFMSALMSPDINLDDLAEKIDPAFVQEYRRQQQQPMCVSDQTPIQASSQPVVQLINIQVGDNNCQNIGPTVDHSSDENDTYEITRTDDTDPSEETAEGREGPQRMTSACAQNDLSMSTSTYVDDVRMNTERSAGGPDQCTLTGENRDNKNVLFDEKLNKSKVFEGKPTGKHQHHISGENKGDSNPSRSLSHPADDETLVKSICDINESTRNDTIKEENSNNPSSDTSVRPIQTISSTEALTGLNDELAKQNDETLLKSVCDINKDYIGDDTSKENTNSLRSDNSVKAIQAKAFSTVKPSLNDTGIEDQDSITLAKQKIRNETSALKPISIPEPLPQSQMSSLNLTIHDSPERGLHNASTNDNNVVQFNSKLAVSTTKISGREESNEEQSTYMTSIYDGKIQHSRKTNEIEGTASQLRNHDKPNSSAANISDTVAPDKVNLFEIPEPIGNSSQLEKEAEMKPIESDDESILLSIDSSSCSDNSDDDIRQDDKCDPKKANVNSDKRKVCDTKDERYGQQCAPDIATVTCPSKNEEARLPPMDFDNDQDPSGSKQTLTGHSAKTGRNIALPQVPDSGSLELPNRSEQDEMTQREELSSVQQVASVMSSPIESQLQYSEAPEVENLRAERDLSEKTYGPSREAGQRQVESVKALNSSAEQLSSARPAMPGNRQCRDIGVMVIIALVFLLIGIFLGPYINSRS